MAARTIRSGIGSYQGKDGRWTHGVMGDVVDVHKDDLERFDRLNPAEQPAAPELTSDQDVASFSQDDIDAAVKAAVDAKDAELAAAKKALDEKTQAAATAADELATVRAELEAAQDAAKAPAKK